MRQALGRPAVAMGVGALAIAAGAQISVPMVPVPTTLQTLALFVVALLGGGRIGAGAAGVYLGLTLLGLPVLSEGKRLGGTAFFTYVGAGYVVGFVLAGGLAGWMAERAKGFPSLCVAALVGHVVILALGAAVMAGWLGPAAAWSKGVQPFLVGAVAKSVVPAGLVWALRRARQDRP